MPRPRQPSDLQLRALLVLITVAVRLPFWRAFDLVTFDGAFYINQAKALLHFSLGGGVFSIGYPLLIAPVMLIVRDGVLAARLISFLAATGSVLLMYSLCKRFVGRTLAFVGAAVLSVTPLFILVSLLSNAEALLVFWLMLGVVWYEQWRASRSGLAMGLAAATRPEALAVAGALGLARLRAPRGLATFALACVAVYAVNVAAISVARGSFTPFSRSASYRSPDIPWQALERRVEGTGVEAVPETSVADHDSDYASRFPRALVGLGRQLLPLIPFLALIGMVRRPNFVLAMLAPLPLLPLFTLERDQTRWALLAPYLPPLIFYAMVALDGIRRPRARFFATAIVLLSTGLGFWINRSLLEPAAEIEFMTTRDVARRFAPNVRPDDLIADRKPYFALYSGGRYVEIPVANYDATIAFLAKSDVRYLSLHPKTAILRPALLQLVYDAPAVRGELRYRQVLVEDTGEIVMERARADDPLTLEPITDTKAVEFAPAWSPDGSRLAFRRSTAEGESSIWIVDASGQNARELVKTDLERDALAWSPDGTRIAYAARKDGQLDLFAVDAAYGRVTPLFSSPEFEWSPSWVRATGALVFCGDPDQLPSVWIQHGNRVPQKISGSEPADLASASPSGARVSWVDIEGRLLVLEVASRHIRRIEEPRQIVSTASWSADERYVAVEAYDWGSSNVYVIDVDSARAVM
ncbi:MAG TPA: glycosyltransferase family 39 protein, partial [Candidatus Krumholzibacteria bacterium]|nr:glycosyltransferase family 39 protein [Candidatus Krumholzibacteria bacterium]